MRRTPKISTVKAAALGQNLDLAVSGKNVFHGKNDMFNNNKNEFTFSPSHNFDGPTKDGPVTFKRATPKNPFEKNLLQDKNPNESLTKNEIFDRLGIKNPEAEQVADLSMHSMVMGAGQSIPKSKKDVTNHLISNLETEIEKLKYKRDNYIADKEKKRREQLLNARRLPDQDEETNIILHRDEERMQQVLHPISSLEKPTLENVEALLRAHKEKMQELERGYMERKKHQMLNADFDYDEPTGAESVKNAPIKSINVPEEFRKGKENYHGVERPKSSNPYMSQKEYEKKKREAEALKLQKKKEDARNYQEKFNEYIYDKRDYLDYQDQEKEKNAAAGKPPILSSTKDFDRYQPTSPNPKRSKSRNKWDAESIVEKDEAMKRSKSPQKERHQSPHEGHERAMTAKSEKAKRASRFGDHSPGKSPSRERVRSSSPLRKSVRIKDTNGEPADISEQEVKLLHFVFNMMRKNGAETVDKEDICDYVLRSPEILELYEIDAANLRNNLYGFATKDRDTVFFEEFLSFMENSRAGNIERLNTDMNQSGGFRRSASKNRKSGVRFSPERKSTKLSKAVENACMLADETLDTIREVFNEVDKHEDLIVKRQALVKRLREDVRIMRVLHKPAVHIVEIDKYLTMERLLRQIEEEETNAIGEQKRAKEYISLNQFLKYFTNYETPDDLAEKMGEFQKTQSTKKSPSRSTRGGFDEDDQDIIEVANKHMQFFQQIFDAQPKKRQAFVETMSFIDSIRGDDRYVMCRRDPARRKAQHFDLQAENIEQALNRLEMEAEKYISWDDFVQFFTRRGRPKRLLTTTYNVEQDLIQSGMASDPKDKAAQTGAKIVQNRPRDGYDSDPEFHTYNKQINYEFQLRRSPQAEIQEEMRSSKERSTQKRTRGEFSPQKSIGIQNDFDNQAWTERPTKTENGDNEGWVERRGRRKTEGNEEFDYNPKFGAVYKDPRGLKYTVPDPFEFDNREQVRSKSIRERRVEEMVQEKRDEEERILNHRFRANSVPGIVKTPLFEKIMHEQEQKRAQVKKNSVAITKMREAPFNFYLRDKEKPPKPEYQLNSEFDKRFKAKPIPAICQLTDVWRNMKEREDIERKERVARLAQQNLLLASLPPRMAKHEKEKKEQELRNQINEKNMERQQDRKTFVANEVPNFDRLHKQFQDLLDRKRSNKRPTETKPFAFQESKKGVMRNYLDVENQYKKAAKDETRRDPFESVRKLKSIKPKMQPHTTKKMIALSDLRKKEREEKQRKAEQLEKEEEERKARYHKMKPLVQGSSAIADNKNEKEQRAKEIKEEVKKTFMQNQRNFEDQKRAIEEKVAKRPLLVEQVTGKSQKQQLQAMHDLNKLNKIMKEAGVRDPKTYFSQDERDKIEDAEYLEKRGFKNFNKADE